MIVSTQLIFLGLKMGTSLYLAITGIDTKYYLLFLLLFLSLIVVWIFWWLIDCWLASLSFGR